MAYWLNVPWNDHVPHMEIPCRTSLHLLPPSSSPSPSTLLLPPSQSKHLPQSLPEIQALQQLQAELGQSGQAVLLLCDCGGKYLCIDSQERKKVGRQWEGRRWEGRPEDRPPRAGETCQRLIYADYVLSILISLHRRVTWSPASHAALAP